MAGQGAGSMERGIERITNMKTVIRDNPLTPEDAACFLDSNPTKKAAKREGKGSWHDAVRKGYFFILPRFSNVHGKLIELLADGDGAQGNAMLIRQGKIDANLLPWRSRKFDPEVIELAIAGQHLRYDDAITMALAVNHLIDNRIDQFDELAQEELEACTFGLHSIVACIFYLEDGRRLLDTAVNALGASADVPALIGENIGQPRSVIERLLRGDADKKSQGKKSTGEYLASHRTVKGVLDFFGEIPTCQSIIGETEGQELIQRVHVGQEHMAAVPEERIDKAKEIKTPPFDWAGYTSTIIVGAAGAAAAKAAPKPNGEPIHTVPQSVREASQFLDANLLGVEPYFGTSDERAWIAGKGMSFLLPRFGTVFDLIMNRITGDDDEKAQDLLARQCRSIAAQIPWSEELDKDASRDVVDRATKSEHLRFDEAVVLALSVNHVIRHRIRGVDPGKRDWFDEHAYGRHSVKSCCFYLFDGHFLYETAQRAAGSDRDILREAAEATGQPLKVVKKLIGNQCASSEWSAADIDKAAKHLASFGTVFALYRFFQKDPACRLLFEGRTLDHFIRCRRAGSGKKNPVANEKLADTAPVLIPPYDWPAAVDGLEPSDNEEPAGEAEGGTEEIQQSSREQGGVAVAEAGSTGEQAGTTGERGGSTGADNGSEDGETPTGETSTAPTSAPEDNPAPTHESTRLFPSGWATSSS